ncbi:hypothetical protein AVEN_228380-1 [Araneus ventricosus]|uniref:Uncharacterized protein n=1 Tax=Araneus ventricosus TaxID=182803 RepID=A0A4Y2UJM4_ARAVE|nr:hypothetical protein AVEN_228380-1 [Araneus ventricosus]
MLWTLEEREEDITTSIVEATTQSPRSVVRVSTVSRGVNMPYSTVLQVMWRILVELNDLARDFDLSKSKAEILVSPQDFNSGIFSKKMSEPLHFAHVICSSNLSLKKKKVLCSAATLMAY